MMKYTDHEVVNNLLWKDYFAKLHLEKSDKLVIFGCGDLGTKFLANVSYENKKRISCFCDNNEKKWGELMDGISVCSPEQAVCDYPEAIYIIAIARGASGIEEQLCNLGIDKGNIRILVLDNSGKYDREYLSERLSSSYYLDNDVPAEATIPVVKNIDREDRRDFRIYVESGLANKLDTTGGMLDFPFMDEYEKYYGKYIRIDDCILSDDKKNSVKVMITCSHKDYAYMEDDSKDIYIPIQVGKALTDVDLYEFKDNIGENISDRNYNYCECTALYWAWKNGFAKDDDYLGLRHYRRRFEASDDSLRSLKANGIDIVHLDPIYHDNIRYSFTNHTKNENDWDVMKEGIHNIFPTYDDAMETYEKQHFVCGYNMNILRRDIFDEYCEFLFGVLFYVENHYLKICDRRDRYLGFLAENLFGVFLIKNKNRYRSAITKLVPYIKY